MASSRFLYDYDHVDPAPLARLSGKLTRFGDVARCCSTTTTSSAWSGLGDEVRLEFAGSGLPAAAGVDAELCLSQLSATARTPTRSRPGGTRSSRFRGAGCRRIPFAREVRRPATRLTNHTFARIRLGRPGESNLDDVTKSAVDDPGTLHASASLGGTRRLPLPRLQCGGRSRAIRQMSLFVLVSVLLAGGRWRTRLATLVRSARGGRWSAGGPGREGRCPDAGERVQMRAGHVVTYDIKTSEPIRSIHVAGVLRFDPERDTRLDVGLIKIQAGDDAGESGFDCEEHVQGVASEAGGSGRFLKSARPITRSGRDTRRSSGWRRSKGSIRRTARRLFVAAGGWTFTVRASRTWVKLGAAAAQGGDDGHARRAGEGLAGGDRVIMTATHKQKAPDEGNYPSDRSELETEERAIRSIDGRA